MSAQASKHPLRAVGRLRQAEGVLRRLTIIALVMVLTLPAALALPGAEAAGSGRSTGSPLIVLRDGRHWTSTRPGTRLAAQREPVSGRLPRTGAAAGLFALAGIGLLLLGGGMRLTGLPRGTTLP
jgi:LPXTG-motif cell wall-anchored protein